MFVHNVQKCTGLFDKVYVSSDSEPILETAKQYGAIAIKRPLKLCGETPSIMVYDHAQKTMDADIVVAVQANSPTIDIELIRSAKIIMETGRFNELMTISPDRKIIGSIWALKKEKLLNYGDFYVFRPDVTLVDPAIDIHTEDDYDKAKKQYENNLL
jgi:CMP-N-acetylneuraminic acid synthetase